MKRIYQQSDLAQPQVLHMEVWTQWHRIPNQALTHEGLLLLSGQIGTALSEVEEIFAGNLFYKIKMHLPIDKPLNATIEARHPTLGILKIYLVYERLNNECLFCANIGHLHNECPDKLRMARLKMNPRFRDRVDMHKLTKPKIGAWVNNSAMVPLADQPPQPP